MTNQDSNVAEVIGNVEVVKFVKVAKVAKTRKSKQEVLVVEEVIETIETTKVKVDKNKELFATLSKLTNLSVAQLKTFAILNLAKRKVKINLTKFLTQMILNVASSKLEIKEVESKILEDFLTKISENSNLEVEQIKDFLIVDLAKSNKKVLLKDFMLEMFFNVVTNKNNIKETIAKF